MSLHVLRLPGEETARKFGRNSRAKEKAERLAAAKAAEPLHATLVHANQRSRHEANNTPWQSIKHQRVGKGIRISRRSINQIIHVRRSNHSDKPQPEEKAQTSAEAFSTHPSHSTTRKPAHSSAIHLFSSSARHPAGRKKQAAPSQSARSFNQQLFSLLLLLHPIHPLFHIHSLASRTRLFPSNTTHTIRTKKTKNIRDSFHQS